MSMSCCMCEPHGDSPVSLAMTHMRWLRGQRGRESTDYTNMCVPWCRWVASLAHR